MPPTLRSSPPPEGGRARTLRLAAALARGDDQAVARGTRTLREVALRGRAVPAAFPHWMPSGWHASFARELERQLTTRAAEAPRAPPWVNRVAQLYVAAGGVGCAAWAAAWLRQGMRGAAAFAELSGEAPLPPHGTVAGLLLPGAVAAGTLVGAWRLTSRLRDAPLSQQTAWFGLTTALTLLVALRHDLATHNLAGVLVGAGVAVASLHGLESRAAAARSPDPEPSAPTPVPPVALSIFVSPPTPPAQSSALAADYEWV